MAQAQHANDNKITKAQQALMQSYSTKLNLILLTKQQIGTITVNAGWNNHATDGNYKNG